MHNTEVDQLSKNSKAENPYGFTIVGIGASAGGLNALKAFFSKMPTNTGTSFVVVQHLSPNHKSLMADILSKSTSLPIKEVLKNTLVKPNHIYLIPPKKNIEIHSNTLELLDKPTKKGLNLPIDIFFNSLAIARHEYAVAIVLSGTGSDGSAGVKNIHAHNGLVIVQDHNDAEFSGMVDSAINTGYADYILAADKIPEVLSDFVNNPKIKFGMEHEVQRDKNRFNKVISHLKNISDYDFTSYKSATLIRRIARRIQMAKKKSFVDYYDFLLNNQNEAVELTKDLLINVTEFFRDKSLWDKLEEVIIPEIVEKVENGGTIKVWVAACSTGQEAYSYAICLDRELKRQEKINVIIKIFATDLNEDNVEFGSIGEYSTKDMLNCPTSVRFEYFDDLGNGRWRVKDRIRSMILFNRHDIINDPPFTKLQLISCRNLLIYLNRETQEKIIRILQYALKMRAVLVLGKSETVGSMRDFFLEVDSLNKIYKNLTLTKTLLKHNINITKTKSLVGINPRTIDTAGQVLKSDFNDVIAKGLTNELNFSILYLDSHLNILHAVGSLKPYLKMPEEGFSNSLFELLPPTLKSKLNLALIKAEKSNEKVLIEVSDKKLDSELKHFNIVLFPSTKEIPDAIGNYIVIFAPNTLYPKDVVKLSINPENEQNSSIEILENELADARQTLISMQHEIELRNEELQTTNEELLATNEELQSTNEELQSVNEELHTVNAELNLKIQDLAQTNATIDNILKSTKINTLVLDRELCIKNFTPETKQFFNITKNDFGRPLSAFSNNIGIPTSTFLDNCKKVIQKGIQWQEEVNIEQIGWSLLRITPFIQSNQKIEGVVITFVDISRQKEAQIELEQKEHEIRSLFNNAPDMFFAANAEGTIVNANLELITKLEYDSAKDIIGKSVLDIAEGFTKEELDYDMNLLFQGKELKGLNRTVITKTGKKIPVLVNAKPYLNKDGSINQVIASWRDVTELRKAEELQQIQMKAFEECTDGFYDWDIKNNTIYTSKSIKDWFGFEESEMPNTLDSWRKLMLKEDLITMNASLDQHFESDGKILHISNERYKHKDGSLVHLQARGKVIEWDEKGEPVRMVGSHTNMTKLLQLPILEQKLVDQNMAFEQVLESTLAGFWDWDIPGNTEYMSPTFKKMFGYEDHEIENTPDWWQRNIHPDDLPGVFEVFEAHVKSKGQIPYDNEVRYYHKDGSIVWVWCKGKVIEWDENDNPLRMVGSHVDITHLKQLTDSNRELERFAYVASHDLQEPLRTVTDFVKLFKDEYNKEFDKEAHIYLDFIESAAGRMSNLVKGILEYSKIKGNSDHEKVDLDTVLKNVVHDLQIKIDDKKADVTIQKMPVVNGNAIELHSLFLNLMGNALKFVDSKKSPKINISVKKSKDKYQFKVQDNGIGIKPEHQEKIFDIFSRLHNEDSYEGTGIGLAHCQKIVEMHGGAIWVESTYGQGSTFYFTLKTT